MKFAVIDSGTTTTRIYIVDEETKTIIASGRTKVGVRDTSITGSNKKLKEGVSQLFFGTLDSNNIPRKDVAFAITSGMITSEIGLMEIPHLIAPVGLDELTNGIVEVNDPEILPIGCPVYFVRGIKNNFANPAKAYDLRNVDFMRGEEVQCIGIMNNYDVPYPCNLVTLSSHTKIMYIDANKKIAASCTTISGQLYEALISSTNIGASLVDKEGEEAGGYTDDELIDIAADCIKNAGLVRTCLMPRFLQTLMKTNSHERQIFIDAAIAYDDLKAFHEMRDKGFVSDYYLLYGHEVRCQIYEKLLKKEFGENLIVKTISDQNEIDQLTVSGAITVALNKIK